MLRLRRKSRQGNVIREGSKAYKADLEEIQEDSKDSLMGLIGFRVQGLTLIGVQGILNKKVEESGDGLKV